MKLSQQEIDEALAHEREMLHVLRQRLRQRELQEAQYGINVPPEITIEIATLTDRIRTHEAEFTRLRLRIPLVQAQELEHEARAALAREAFSHLTPKENVGLDKVLARNSTLTLNERLREAIWRAIRLDIPTAAEEVAVRIDRKDVVADWDRFRSLLVEVGA